MKIIKLLSETEFLKEKVLVIIVIKIGPIRPILLSTALVLMCFLLFSEGLIGQKRGLKFRDDYSLEKAIQVAQIEDKNIFIDTYTPWCGPCKRMDIQFQDKSLGAFFNKHYISIKINMDSQYGPAVKSKYDVFFLPTLLIIDKYGNAKYASEGLLTSDELLAFGKHFYNEIYSQEELANVTASNEIVVAAESKSTIAQEKPIAKEKEIASNSNPASVSPILGVREKPDEQTILYTQNDATRDPDFLYNLTYLHLQLQDGQQWLTAEKYLETQKDWGTRKNMSFIYDFVRRPGTKLFDHIIDNRVDYDILFGQQNVNRSISIMINMRLHQGYPRPDQEEAFALFKILDYEVAEIATYNYLLERYEEEENYEVYVPLALKYLEEIDADNFSIINNIATYYESSTTNLSVDQLIKMMKHAIEIQGGSYYVLYETLASLYFKKGKKRKALASIEKAIDLASASGIDLSDLNHLKEMIREL